MKSSLEAVEHLFSCDSICLIVVVVEYSLLKMSTGSAAVCLYKRDHAAGTCIFDLHHEISQQNCKPLKGMRMKKGFVGILMMLASAITINSYAQKPAVVLDNEEGWQKIGETKASFKSQAESIAVLGADEFTAIKIKVNDAPLNIDRLQVFYETGEMESIDIESAVEAGQTSDVINLKHADKDIQKVAFTYNTEENAEGEKASVELYGLKTNQPQGRDTYRDEANEVKRDVEQAADEVGEEATEAANEVEQEAEEVAEDVDVDARAENTERDIEQAAENTGDDIERAAERTGDVVSEGVNDAAAAIEDEKLEDKVGPNGETAYVDDDGNFYYINNEGKKVHITALQLQEKAEK